MLSRSCKLSKQQRAATPVSRKRTAEDIVNALSCLPVISDVLNALRAIGVRHEASSWVYACFLSIRLFCNPALIIS